MKSPFSILNAETLQSIAEKTSQLLPNESTREEMQRTIQLLVQNALARLDLVTREEFDAQAAVLQKTRSKVEALEVQLQALEKSLQNQKS
ncbi:MAG: accessory factor UbiK family protein [Pseudomonadales bacterium]|nr:accessory factor UbiK family protein [Pseudomonadales bacterium]